MTVLNHPHVPDVSVTVKAEDVDRWVRSGWVDPTEKPEPEAVEPEEEPKAKKK